MASLAGMLQACGAVVTGSDENVYPPMSTMLASLGIDVKQGYKPAHLDPAPDCVVIGNAIHVEILKSKRHSKRKFFTVRRRKW